MNVSIQLTFNGQCEEAFRFYERCMDAKVTFMLTWGGSPMASQVPAEWQGKLLHATLQLGDLNLNGFDQPPGTYQAPQGFAVTLTLAGAVDAERVFQCLADGGNVGMPLQETFWALRFGVVVDRFGIPWQIQCEKS